MKQHLERVWGLVGQLATAAESLPATNRHERECLLGMCHGVRALQIILDGLNDGLSPATLLAAENAAGDLQLNLGMVRTELIHHTAAA